MPQIPAYASYPSLSGRVVLVTGGASGIGAEIVRAFAANQARIAFLDIDRPSGQALAAATGALFLPCDITDTEALQAAISAVRQQLGLIAVLINNAANDQRHQVDEVTPDYWDRAQAINLRHLFFAAQAVRPDMQGLGGGAIVNLSSVTWRYGPANMVAYATAKAAIIGLTHSLARALGDDNIRVNAIEPGAVMTEKQRQLWYPSQADVDAMVDRQILKRVLQPADVARMALFLSADDSAMITKHTFVVDAGLT